MAIALGKPSDKADRPESAPDSDSRSVVRAGAQKAAFDTTERSLCGCSRKRAFG